MKLSLLKCILDTIIQYFYISTRLTNGFQDKWINNVRPIVLQIQCLTTRGMRFLRIFVPIQVSGFSLEYFAAFVKARKNSRFL